MVSIGLYILAIDALSGILRRNKFRNTGKASQRSLYEHLSRLNVTLPLKNNRLNIDLSDLKRLGREIDKIIKQEKSDDKVQKILRLEAMLECEISTIKYSPFRYSQWTHDRQKQEEMHLMLLKQHLKRIQDHFDASLWDDTYFDEDSKTRKISRISPGHFYLSL